MRSRIGRPLLYAITSLAVVGLAIAAFSLPALAQGPWGGWGRPGGMMGWPGRGGSANCPLQGGGGPFAPAGTGDPLTVDETLSAVEGYLSSLNDPNLAVAEIMVFDNHSYARIVERDTGIGALEVIVDPTTGAVYPEMGPNMMWNLKYGMHRGFGGMMGGMMGRGGFGARQSGPFATTPSSEMDVTAEQARELAQAYLDRTYSGRFQVAEEANPFYGYYTMDIEEDGGAVGMLSVHGYSGDVFLHTWHGQFVEAAHDLE